MIVILIYVVDVICMFINNKINNLILIFIINSNNNSNNKVKYNNKDRYLKDTVLFVHLSYNLVIKIQIGFVIIVLAIIKEIN
mmetsp:Transcript_1123/g.120  ORF Transcript_1123/g.120 Transcript_1123/m.120 type:complete len:82 (+) Transcript_1123:60-305(+)